MNLVDRRRKSQAEGRGIAPWVAPETEAGVEVRTCMGEEYNGNPVTGSLNAGLAQWLTGVGMLSDWYMVSHGSAMARRGRLQIDSVNEVLSASGR